MRSFVATLIVVGLAIPSANAAESHRSLILRLAQAAEDDLVAAAPRHAVSEAPPQPAAAPRPAVVADPAPLQTLTPRAVPPAPVPEASQPAPVQAPAPAQAQIAPPPAAPVPQAPAPQAAAPLPPTPAPLPSQPIVAMTGEQMTAIGVGIIGGLLVLDGVIGVPPAAAAFIGGLAGQWWYGRQQAPAADYSITHRVTGPLWHDAALRGDGAFERRWLDTSPDRTW
ncbi:MAG: hypothetical protein K2X44_00650 [Magnetospirillum sp.]|nr:hypothetical protein [Magnetospirillum sp.]